MTTELLESILRFLPMKDLLLAQRVSHKWKAVITGNTELQQLLFMAPKESTSRWQTWWSTNLTKLLVGASPDKDHRIVDCGQPNPLLFHDGQKDVIMARVEFGDDMELIVPLPRLMAYARQSPKPSFYNMLICQPPLKDAEISVHLLSRSDVAKGKPVQLSWEMSKSKGLRVRHLVREVREVERERKQQNTNEEAVRIEIRTFGMLLPTEEEMDLIEGKEPWDEMKIASRVTKIQKAQ